MLLYLCIHIFLSCIIHFSESIIFYLFCSCHILIYLISTIYFVNLHIIMIRILYVSLYLCIDIIRLWIEIIIYFNFFTIISLIIILYHSILILLLIHWIYIVHLYIVLLVLFVLSFLLVHIILILVLSIIIHLYIVLLHTI